MLHLNTEKWIFAIVVLLVDLPQTATALRVAMPSSERPGLSATGSDDEVFQKIERLIALHEFDRAEQLLTGLLPPGGKAAPAYFRMGQLYFEHEEWARAAGFLQKSLRLANQNDQAHLLLGLAWRKLEKPEDAELELLEAAKENPRSAVNAYLAGHQLLIMGKSEAALPYLYKTIELNPHRSDAFRALGMAQAHLGNYGLAESYYRKAIEGSSDPNPPDPATYIDLAFLLLLGHDPVKVADGLKYAQRAAQFEPSSADAHYLVGKALMKLGRVKEAVRELLQAAKLNPEDSKPHFLLARAFGQLGDEHKAKIEREALARIKRRPARAGIATGSAIPSYPDR